jgi:hypothetical protein
MFRGGSGGEFLISKIYQYSNKFKNINYIKKDDEIGNKTRIFYPAFYERLFTVPQQQPLILSHLLKLVDSNMLDEVEVYLENYINYTPLHRCHFINSNYFIKRSFLIFLDEERWSDYGGLLACIKNRTSRLDLEPSLTFNYNRYKTLPYNDLAEVDTIIKQVVEYLDSNNLDSISEIYARCLINKKITDVDSADTVLNMPVGELYYKHRYSLAGTYSDYRQIANLPFLKIVNYSKYFEKGYLEDIFEIDSTTFNDELIEWHEKNLELLSEYNIDYTQFKLI